MGTEEAAIPCVGKNRRTHACGSQQRGSAMERSGSLETGSSAEHFLSDPWRKIVGAQPDRWAVTFDLVMFVFSSPLKGANFLSIWSGFGSRKKTHTPCELAKTADTRR